MLTQADMRNKIICGDALDVLRSTEDARGEYGAIEIIMERLGVVR